MSTLLDNLIANEIGTSAFLATVLDRNSTHSVFVEARKIITALLIEHGLELSDPTPEHVELEYLNIDLVAVWSGWTILVENKVASASVARGQLNQYYQSSLTQIERHGFLKHAGEAISEQPICFIYLTPTSFTGKIEFESLKTVRCDRKIHLNWGELLNRLAPLLGRSNDHEAWFFGMGIQRIGAVLQQAKQSKLPEDENRCSIQAVMNELKGMLQSSECFEDLVFCRWSDQTKEQLFAAGPARSSYVGIYVLADASDFRSPHTIRAVGYISFDVASKHRRRLRNVMEGKSSDAWATMLGVTSEATLLTPEKGSLSWQFNLPEISRDEFKREMVQRLSKFSSVFSAILREVVSSPPAVAADAPHALHR